MHDVGEVQLHLPELDDGWCWRLRVTEENSLPILEMVIARGLRYSKEETTKPQHGEVWYCMTVALTALGGTYRDKRMVAVDLPRAHDEIVADAQKQVNSRYEEWRYRDTPRLSANDAVRHITEVFKQYAAEHDLDQLEE